MNYEGQMENTRQGIFSSENTLTNTQASVPERDSKMVGNVAIKRTNGLEMPSENSLQRAALEGAVAGNEGDLGVRDEKLGEIIDLGPENNVVEKTNTDRKIEFSSGKEFSKEDGKITDEEIKKIMENPFMGYESLQGDRDAYQEKLGGL